MTERLVRAQLIQLEVDRLRTESRDPRVSEERLSAIADELLVLLDSARDLRREQLMEELELRRYRRKPGQTVPSHAIVYALAISIAVWCLLALAAWWLLS